MLRNRLLAVGLRAGGPHREALQRAAVNYAGARRRHASSTTTEMTGDNVRQKTIDDLGGPSFLATFNWLFVKGYLPKTQQMQVSGARTFPPMRACRRGYLRHHLRVNADQFPTKCEFYSTSNDRKVFDLHEI